MTLFFNFLTSFLLAFQVLSTPTAAKRASQPTTLSSHPPPAPADPGASYEPSDAAIERYNKKIKSAWANVNDIRHVGKRIDDKFGDGRRPYDLFLSRWVQEDIHGPGLREYSRKLTFRDYAENLPAEKEKFTAKLQQEDLSESARNEALHSLGTIELMLNDRIIDVASTLADLRQAAENSRENRFGFRDNTVISQLGELLEGIKQSLPPGDRTSGYTSALEQLIEAAKAEDDFKSWMDRNNKFMPLSEKIYGGEISTIESINAKFAAMEEAHEAILELAGATGQPIHKRTRRRREFDKLVQDSLPISALQSLSGDVPLSQINFDGILRILDSSYPSIGGMNDIISSELGLTGIFSEKVKELKHLNENIEKIEAIQSFGRLVIAKVERRKKRERIQKNVAATTVQSFGRLVIAKGARRKREEAKKQEEVEKRKRQEEIERKKREEIEKWERQDEIDKRKKGDEEFKRIRAEVRAREAKKGCCVIS